jgi:xylan 1,4-beta-xylosidase
LKGTGVAREENFVLTKDSEGTLHGVAWNPVEDMTEKSDLELNITLPVDQGEYAVVTKLVDETVCNPLKVWLDLGSPSNPSKEQLELIRSCDTPQVLSRREKVTDGNISLSFTLSRNALLYFELRKINPQVDRGFKPERIQGAM